ncbi:hypothetical protein TSUD_203690 [Trifolium subterraneum]|uniref:Uncharacterized protein n=1 Tax=Trifolium subterraneum TaxID=3900 RepID=A0A2Z6M3R4_TRISU|nr:hypothetical protein TSUD_203690 [Trifolium subterraneum]
MFSCPCGTKFASLANEILPSFRPNGTSQNGPPAKIVASLAAAVRMSAHDTVLGHLFSSSTLISSIQLIVTVTIAAATKRATTREKTKVKWLIHQLQLSKT